jgi:hypothetical protein
VSTNKSDRRNHTFCLALTFMAGERP